jgi:hypothetical protein
VEQGWVSGDMGIAKFKFGLTNVLTDGFDKTSNILHQKLQQLNVGQN